EKFLDYFGDDFVERDAREEVALEAMREAEEMGRKGAKPSLATMAM
ncbi:hypothetical protein HY256_01400, partial [Candidatus Sumerlaeota bacterium]|nr:hypothetical protein [Candidatus Sumerlaeota bacterium]